MKHKVIKIIILIILILSVTTIAFNYFFDLGQIIILINPSDEMKRLKQIEDSLNLPPSSSRHVDDEGYITDWKGAHHYSRSISNYYEEKNLILLIKEKVENSGWILDKTFDSLEKGGTRYKYIKDQANAGIFQTEIHLTINPEEIGDPHLLNDDHSITIRSVTKD